MKTPVFSLIALLVLTLSACTHDIVSHLTAKLQDSPYDFVGVDLHSPENDIILHDGKSFYIIAPIVRYNRHTPLMEARHYDEASRYPAVRNVRKIPGLFLTRVTPGKSGEKADVSLWLLTKKLTPSASEEKGKISLHIVGEKTQETIKGLSVYQIDKATGELFYKKMGIPHYAEVGPEMKGWKTVLGYSAIPLSIVTALLDSAIGITANTAEAVVMTPIFLAKCCGGAQQQHFEPAEKQPRSAASELVEAEIIKN